VMGVREAALAQSRERRVTYSEQEFRSKM